MLQPYGRYGLAAERCHDLFVKWSFGVSAIVNLEIGNRVQPE